MQLLKKIMVIILSLVCVNTVIASPAVRFSSVPTITGPLVVGHSYSYNYALTGVVNLPVQVAMSIVPGNNPSALRITNNTCSVALNVGQSCSFTVVITPTTGGTLNDSVQVHLNARDSFNPAPSPVQVATIANTAYVANYANNSVSTCTINSNGALIDCNATLEAVDLPVAIALNPALSYAYLTSDGGGVSVCQMNDGVISQECVPTGGSFANPYAITFNSSGTYAYVANAGNNQISKCTVGADGALTFCTDSGASGLNTPYSVVLNAQGDIAYIANFAGNSISQCTVEVTGNLSGCSNAVLGGTTLNAPSAIALSPNGLYAYVVDYGSQGVIQFSVDQSTGKLTNTTPEITTPPFVSPRSIALVAVDQTATFAYVTDEGYSDEGATFACSVSNTDGTLSNCNPVTTSFDTPIGIFAI